MSLELAKLRAERVIDELAGEVRLRYITEVPGQQAVYLVKLQEAQAYLQAHAPDSEAAVPPYLAAVAAATAQAPVAVAEEIAWLGTLWNEQIGPAIEAARLSGKKAARAASSEQGVQEATAAAVAALRAL